ncbi:MAG: HNH endonuclease [Deltaproteobacteria bacterium]|nr:HNH endonuclease [Deltaproteobacteria bacterium]
MTFLVEISDQQLRREKDKARELRKSRWWSQKTAAGLCYYCGAEVAPKELTLDHLVPLIRGGRSTRGNCVPACKECNSRKKYLLPLEWEEHLQRIRNRE